MEQFALLDAASGEFAKRLRVVAPAQWELPTPCAEWNVRQLVSHVVAGNRMASILLRGGTRDDALAPFATDVLGANPVEAFNGSYRLMYDAAKRPGALDRVVPHPAFEMPATTLFGFRVTDLALHGWDLARATGQDETIHPDVVAALWDQLAPDKEMIAASGAFGSGASRSLGDEAPLQARVLDLCGRRP
jgi:uncharacterized protein (TIGR03086 family)